MPLPAPGKSALYVSGALLRSLFVSTAHVGTHLSLFFFSSDAHDNVSSQQKYSFIKIHTLLGSPRLHYFVNRTNGCHFSHCRKPHLVYYLSPLAYSNIDLHEQQCQYIRTEASSRKSWSSSPFDSTPWAVKSRTCLGEELSQHVVVE